MTGAQKDVADKMLAEILDETVFERRIQRVHEYNVFMEGVARSR